MTPYFLTTTNDPDTVFTAPTLTGLTTQLVEHAQQITGVNLSETSPNDDVIPLAAKALGCAPRSIVLLTPDSPLEAWQLVENRQAKERHEIEITRLSNERDPLLQTLVKNGLPLRHAGALAGISQTHVKRIITQ